MARAAVCREYGAPDVVRVEEWDAGPVGPKQVRVRVQAASVNFPDVLIVANQYQMSWPPPFVPGSEYGVIAEVGEGVDGFAVGGAVFGTGPVGAFAEEVVTGASSLTRTPAGVTAAKAAAFGVASRTAAYALRSFARVGEGDEVIVLGAGGGVGSAAVQRAVAYGATVTAVASTREKLEVAAACGATHLVAHRGFEGPGELRNALREVVPDGAHAVIDPVGGELSEPALRSLRWGGRFVTLGYASGTIPRIPLNLVLLKGIEVVGFQIIDFMTHRPDDLVRDDAEAIALFAEGKVDPFIGARFPLDDVAHALRHVADGKALGKVVLELA
ncbi:MAG: NADPH:quinone oxidoreductase family protein [Acidimicrobiia bacterium]